MDSKSIALHWIAIEAILWLTNKQKPKSKKANSQIQLGNWTKQGQQTNQQQTIRFVESVLVSCLARVCLLPLAVWHLKCLLSRSFDNPLLKYHPRGLCSSQFLVLLRVKRELRHEYREAIEATVQSLPERQSIRILVPKNSEIIGIRGFSIEQTFFTKKWPNIT